MVQLSTSVLVFFFFFSLLQRKDEMEETVVTFENMEERAETYEDGSVSSPRGQWQRKEKTGDKHPKTGRRRVKGGVWSLGHVTYNSVVCWPLISSFINYGTWNLAYFPWGVIRDKAWLDKGPRKTIVGCKWQLKLFSMFVQWRLFVSFLNVPLHGVDHESWINQVYWVTRSWFLKIITYKSRNIYRKPLVFSFLWRNVIRNELLCSYIGLFAKSQSTFMVVFSTIINSRVGFSQGTKKMSFPSLSPSHPCLA